MRDVGRGVRRLGNDEPAPIEGISLGQCHLDGIDAVGVVLAPKVVAEREPLGRKAAKALPPVEYPCHSSCGVLASGNSHVAAAMAIDATMAPPLLQTAVGDIEGAVHQGHRAGRSASWGEDRRVRSHRAATVRGGAYSARTPSPRAPRRPAPVIAANAKPTKTRLPGSGTKLCWAGCALCTLPPGSCSVTRGT